MAFIVCDSNVVGNHSILPMKRTSEIFGKTFRICSHDSGYLVRLDSSESNVV